MASNANKSSHSPRRASARKRAGANRSRRSTSPAKPSAAPAKPVAPATDGAEVKPSIERAMEAKREEPVRRVEMIPLARPFYDCPRCANRHESLEVKRLTRPADGFSHFAICPNLGEPIIMAVGGA